MAKEKKVKTGPKSKWAVWKTILVILSSVVLVCGAVVLGVYFTKGFGGEKINPQSISFSLDDEKYNTDNSQFEVTADFDLLLNTPTENVTEKEVILSFEASSFTRDLVNGTITDGVITVKEKVKIGEKIHVVLNKSLQSFGGVENVEWITGGISKLVATPVSGHVTATSVQIAVDVPVHSIDVELYDASNMRINQITAEEPFTARAKFYPENSRYLYSDNIRLSTVEGATFREKLQFFTVEGAGNVEFVYDDENPYFKAGERFKADNINKVYGYVFGSADIQEAVLARFSEEEGVQRYNSILHYLADTDGVSNFDNPASIEIVEASISGFEVNRASLTFNLTCNMPYLVTMGETAGANNYFDAVVLSGGKELKSYLKNVAISLTYRLRDSWVPVVNGEQITIRAGQAVEIDGKTYYLPNTNVANRPDYTAANFEFITSQELEFRINVVLLVEDGEDEEGQTKYRIYASESGEINVNMKSQIHQESEIYWSIGDGIDLTLNYNGVKPESTTYKFGEDGKAFGVIPEGNIYKDPMYFAYFGTNEQTVARQIADRVLGAGGYDHDGLYLIESQPYYLFPVGPTELPVADTADFQVYVATVKMEDRRYVYTTDSLGGSIYTTVVTCAAPLDVHVVRSLYEGSVKGLASTLLSGDIKIDAVEKDNGIYIYAGSPLSFDLSFEINQDSIAVFEERLSAGTEIEISFLNEANEDITRYFEITRPLQLDYDEINDKYFAKYTFNVRSNVVSQMQLKSVRLAERGTSHVWTRKYYLSLDNTSLKNVFVYEPEVRSINLVSSQDENINLKQEISVRQTLSDTGEFSTLINYYKNSDTGGPSGIFASVNEFVEALKVTVVDNNGNTNVFKRDWSFITDNPKAINVADQTMTFGSVDNAIARVWVICRGVENNVKLTLRVSATGIQVVTYDGSTTIKQTVLPEDWVVSENPSSATISKYAQTLSEGNRINLANLIALYTDMDENGKPKGEAYKGKVIFKLSDNFFSSQKGHLVDLFGEKAMLALYDENQEKIEINSTDAQGIQAELSVKKISGIKINHNFENDASLNFIIRDEKNEGNINISLNFTILANVASTGSTTDSEVYAQVARGVSGNITNNTAMNDADKVVTVQDRIKSLYSNSFIVVDVDQLGDEKFSNETIILDGKQTSVDVYSCVIKEGEKPTNAIGKIDENGNVVFYDFWDSKYKVFRIKFNLEDKLDNYFALSVNPRFIVRRNLRVVNKKIVNTENNVALKVLGDSNRAMDYYFSLERIQKVEGESSFSFVNGETLSIVANERSVLTPAIKSNDGNTLADWSINVATGNDSPLFDYNKAHPSSSFTFKVKVEENENSVEYGLDTLKLEYELGLSTEDIASYFTINGLEVGNDSSDTTLQGQVSVQSINGREYLTVLRSQSIKYDYKNNVVVNNASLYGHQIYEKTTIGGVDYARGQYSLQGEKTIVFKAVPAGIYGLASSEETYIISEFSSGSKRLAMVITPVLISNLGTKFVSYTKEVEVEGEGETTLTEIKQVVKDKENLATAIMRPEELLYKKGIYQTVKAGEKILIGTKYGQTEDISRAPAGLILFDSPAGSANISYNVSCYMSININDNENFNGSYYPALMKGGANWDGKKLYIQLNHLSDKITEAYVAVQVIATNGSWTQAFYYLLKVEPNASVKEPIYAYNSRKENLTIASGASKTINLAEEFGDSTLHNGDTRFNVYIGGDKSENKKAESELVFRHEVVSVEAGTRFEVTPEGYSDLVHIHFNEAKWVEDKYVGASVTIQPLGESTIPMIVKIRRIYCGGDKNTELGIVGGEVEYKFEINVVNNYTLEYSKIEGLGEIKVDQTNKNNAEFEVKSTEASENSPKLEVTLYNNRGIGGNVGQIEKNILAAGFFIRGEDGFVLQKVKENEAEGSNGLGKIFSANIMSDNEKIASMSFNNYNFSLTIVRGEYVTKDEVVKVLFYTEYGQLGELIINIKASASANLKENDTTKAVKAGSYVLKHFVDMKIGETGTENYEVFSATQLNAKQTPTGEGETPLFVFDKVQKSLIFFPSIKEETINLQITVIFTETGYEGKQYTFHLPFVVKPDITQKGSETVLVGTSESTAQQITRNSEETIYAKDDVPVALSDIVNGGASNILFTWKALYGGSFIEDSSTNFKTTINIKTKDVAEPNTSVTVLITGYLLTGTPVERNFDAGEGTSVITSWLYGDPKNPQDKGLGCYATFMVQYTFQIQPNVKITPNYPNPTKDKALKIEYLKDRAAFASATSFINGKAVFSDKNRFVFEKQGSNENVNTSNYSVRIESLQNATIYKGVDDLGKADNDLTAANGILYDGSKAEGQKDVGRFTFRMGTRDATGKIVVRPDESVVVLRVDCNGVTEHYRIVLQESVLTVNINQTNTAGENGAEKIYVDNLTQEGGKNILAGDRIIQFKIKNSSENAGINQIIATPYVLAFREFKSGVWTENFKFYELRTMTLNDIGKTLTFDIAASWTDYKYYGTYVLNAANFGADTNGKILRDSNGNLIGLTREKNHPENITAQATDFYNGLYSDLYSSRPTLTSRILLSYITGNTFVPVDYIYFGEGQITFSTSYPAAARVVSEGTTTPPVTQLNGYKIEPEANELEKVVLLNSFGFSMSNGQIDEKSTLTFSTEYRYCIDIDIDVEASGEKIVTELKVGDVQHLLEDHNVYHPSKGSQLTREELRSSSKSINLEIVGIDKMVMNGNKIVGVSGEKDISEFYNDPQTGKFDPMRERDIKKPYGTSMVYRYLSLSPPENEESGALVDFDIEGFGAQNGGSYVLLYFTYKIVIDTNSYTKEFFLVYKVLPNYEVSFANVAEVDNEIITAGESATMPSNISNPYQVNTTSKENYDQYETLYIAGSKDNTNIVSVKQNGEGAELASTFFGYTLTENQQKTNNGSSIDYNVHTNVQEKLKMSGRTAQGFTQGTNTSGEFTGIWTRDERSEELKFTGVAKVAVGMQYFRLEAKDDYGFKFAVYFVLLSGKVAPEADSSFTTTEGRYFDISAVYEELTLKEVGRPSAEKYQPLDIQSESKHASGESGFDVLYIKNIEAWGYPNKKDDETNDAEYAYMTWNHSTSKYDLKTFSSGDISGYLLSNITEDEKYLRKPDLLSMQIKSIKFYTKDGRFIGEAYQGTETNKVTEFSEVLSTSENLHFGSEYKSAYYKSPRARFKMPTFEDGSVYGSSNNANINMVITFNYSLDSAIETVDVPVAVTVNRDIQLQSVTNNIVRDGEEFNIQDYIDVYSTNGDSSNLNQIQYYDDTLKVTLPGYARIRVSATRKRGDKTVTSAPRDIINSDVSYTKTITTSLSSIMGETSAVGDSYTINIISAGSDALGIKDKAKPSGIIDDREDVYGFYMQYGDRRAYLTRSGTEYSYIYTIEGDGDYVHQSTEENKLTDGNGIELLYKFDACEQLFALNQGTGEAMKKNVDKINFVSASELPVGDNISTAYRYYIASIDNANYQKTQIFGVTGNYYRLNQNATANVKVVDKYLKLTQESKKDRYIIPLQGWTEGMTLDIAEQTYTGLLSKPYDAVHQGILNKLRFELSTKNSSGAIGGSGAATIEQSTGIITTTDNFEIKSHHIVVKVFLKASGLYDEYEQDLESDKLLGTVTFMLQPEEEGTGSLAFTELGVVGETSELITNNVVYKNGEITYAQETIKIPSANFNGYSAKTTVSKTMAKQGQNLSGWTGISGVTLEDQYVFGRGAQLYNLQVIGINQDIDGIYESRPTDMFLEKYNETNRPGLYAIPVQNVKLLKDYRIMKEEFDLSKYEVKHKEGANPEKYNYIKYISPNDGQTYYLRATTDKFTTKKGVKEKETQITVSSTSINGWTFGRGKSITVLGSFGYKVKGFEEATKT